MDAAEKYESAIDAWLAAVIRAWPDAHPEEERLLDAAHAAWDDLTSEQVSLINTQEDGYPMASEYRHLGVELRRALDRRLHQPSCHCLRVLLVRMREIWEQASEDERKLLKPRSSTWPWAPALAHVEGRLAKDINACLPLTRE